MGQQSRKHKRAFFCDRDGIVNRRIVGGYVTRPSEFEMQPHFPEVLQYFVQAGFVPILVTNQQGVGKGIMTELDLAAVHDYMQQQLQELVGLEFADIFYCPKLKTDATNRRKPSPQMLLEACERHGIDPCASYMLGDMQSDADAGKAAGATSILIPDPEVQNPTADIVLHSHKELILKFDDLIH